MSDRNNFLTRKESIEVLYDVINSGILDQDLEDDLIEIASLIEFELRGEHSWGQPYESRSELDVAYRADLITSEIIREADRQHKEAMYIPCTLEMKELIEYYKEQEGLDKLTEEEINNISTHDKEEYENHFAYMHGGIKAELF